MQMGPKALISSHSFPLSSSDLSYLQPRTQQQHLPALPNNIHHSTKKAASTEKPFQIGYIMHAQASPCYASTHAMQCPIPNHTRAHARLNPSPLSIVSLSFVSLLLIPFPTPSIFIQHIRPASDSSATQVFNKKKIHSSAPSAQTNEKKKFVILHPF